MKRVVQLRDGYHWHCHGSVYVKPLSIYLDWHGMWCHLSKMLELVCLSPVMASVCGWSPLQRESCVPATPPQLLHIAIEHGYGHAIPLFSSNPNYTPSGTPNQNWTYDLWIISIFLARALTHWTSKIFWNAHLGEQNGEIRILIYIYDIYGYICIYMYDNWIGVAG